MPELSYKHRMFVEAYLGPSAGNATDAARRAGYRTPHPTGLRLLQKATIRAAIDAKLDSTALTTSEILARLSAIASANLDDFGDISPMGGFTLKLDKAKRRGKLHAVRKLKSTEDGPEIELYNAMDALEKLGRYRGMWKADSDQRNAGPVDGPHALPEEDTRFAPDGGDEAVGGAQAGDAPA